MDSVILWFWSMAISFLLISIVTLDPMWLIPAATWTMAASYLSLMFDFYF